MKIIEIRLMYNTNYDIDKNKSVVQYRLRRGLWHKSKKIQSSYVNTVVLYLVVIALLLLHISSIIIIGI